MDSFAKMSPRTIHVKLRDMSSSLKSLGLIRAQTHSHTELAVFFVKLVGTRPVVLAPGCLEAYRLGRINDAGSGSTMAKLFSLKGYEVRLPRHRAEPNKESVPPQLHSSFPVIHISSPPPCASHRSRVPHV